MTSVRRTNSAAGERPVLTAHRSGALAPWAPRLLVITGSVLLLLMLAIVAPFWFGDLDSEILTVVTPFAMWLPALVVLVVHLILRPPVGFVRWSALRIRPFRPVAATSAVVLLVLVAIPTVVILAASALGVVRLQPADGAGSAALLVLPLALFTLLSTIGEEIAWRGYLQSTLAPLGFWRANTVIGVYWSLWHLPLTATYLLDGTMPAREVLATSVNLVLAAYLLGAARFLSSSVWPAAFGHALINTVLVFAYSNLITPTQQLADGAYWAFQGIAWVTWGIAVVLAGRAVARRGRTGTGQIR